MPARVKKETTDVVTKPKRTRVARASREVGEKVPQKSSSLVSLAMDSALHSVSGFLDNTLDLVEDSIDSVVTQVGRKILFVTFLTLGAVFIFSGLTDYVTSVTRVPGSGALIVGVGSMILSAGFWLAARR